MTDESKKCLLLIFIIDACYDTSRDVSVKGRIGLSSYFGL